MGNEFSKLSLIKKVKLLEQNYKEDRICKHYSPNSVGTLLNASKWVPTTNYRCDEFLMSGDDKVDGKPKEVFIGQYNWEDTSFFIDPDVYHKHRYSFLGLDETKFMFVEEFWHIQREVYLSLVCDAYKNVDPKKFSSVEDILSFKPTHHNFIPVYHQLSPFIIEEAGEYEELNKLLIASLTAAGLVEFRYELKNNYGRGKKMDENERIKQLNILMIFLKE